MDNKTQKIKKIPMRQCLGCNEHRPKKELIRVVRSPEGEISLDFNGKKSGRGAYICKNKDCVDLVIKKRLLNRAFKSNLDLEVYNQLGDYE